MTKGRLVDEQWISIERQRPEYCRDVDKYTTVYRGLKLKMMNDKHICKKKKLNYFRYLEPSSVSRMNQYRIYISMHYLSISVIWRRGKTGCYRRGMVIRELAARIPELPAGTSVRSELAARRLEHSTSLYTTYHVTWLV